MIEILDVSKSFQKTKALNGLTLRVEHGEILGLLGANGAGKSTSINMLMGFVTPDSGTVRVEGMAVADNQEAVRKTIGYIPENVNLYPYLTGTENLDYFCRLTGVRHSKEKLTELLLTCGLQQDAHDQKVSGYSKGMRQKVGIAIAYAKDAKVYLLDEPASGLDPLASNELTGLLKQLAGEGAAILMASHDLFRVREVCHRIGILKRGELVRELRSEEVSAQELEQIYLDYMKN